MLTLQEFTESAERTTLDQAGELLGVDEEFFGPEASAVWLFAEGSFVSETTGGTFWTIIDRSEYETETLEEIAQILYSEWYVTEVADTDAITLREDDGTLDQFVGDMIAALPGIDPEADDWGGIMSLYFTDTTRDSWTVHEAWQLCANARDTYGKRN